MKNTKRHNPSSLPSIFSIATVLVMVGLFMLLVISAQNITQYLRETVNLTVTFHLDTEEADILKLKSELEGRETIKEVVYLSKEQNAELTREVVGDDFISTLEFNPIPASLDVHFVASDATQSSMADLKRELSGHEHVREAFYQAGILNKIDENARKILSVILGLSLLFSIIAITLINSTIRLDLYSKRFLIRSMQLVGAKRWFIIRPFISKAIMNGFWAILIGLLVLGGLSYYLFTLIPDVLEVVSEIDLLLVLGAVVISGILLTGICSFFATRRYLKLKLEELY